MTIPLRHQLLLLLLLLLLLPPPPPPPPPPTEKCYIVACGSSPALSKYFLQRSASGCLGQQQT
jgi:hypothetical protein